MRFSAKFNLVFSLLLSCFLAACGGGDNKTTDPDNLDSPTLGKADSIWGPTDKGEIELFAPIDANLGANDDGFHVYQFKAKKGWNVKFSLQPGASESSWRAYLRVFSAGGAKKGSRGNDDSGAAWVNWALPEDGTYSVLATSMENMILFGGLLEIHEPAGPYVLSVTGDIPCSASADCPAYLGCSGDFCRPACGGFNEACCAGSTCKQTYHCDDGTCRQDLCTTYPTCFGCLQDASCGFCEATGYCKSGTAAGPADGYVCSSGWKFGEGGCGPVICGAAGEPCCTDGPACESSLVCTNNVCNVPGPCGGFNQPCCAGNTCKQTYHCDGGTCKQDPCTNNPTCFGCLQKPDCGFCETTGYCKSGTAAGPADGYACSSGWKFGAGGCGPVICGAAGEPCCTDGPACEGSLVCTNNVCNVAEPCGGFNQVCCAGNTCNQTYHCAGGTCKQDPCTNYPTCFGCTRDASCGFCEATGYCKSGTAVGPADGYTCSSGWKFGSCN